jgi:IclR family pca regulon transcriptional regulator
MESLAAYLDYSVNMGVLDGAAVIYVERVRRQREVDRDLHVGTRLPASISSMGAVLLAALSDSEVLHRLRHRPGSESNESLSRTSAIETYLIELAEVRHSGYVVWKRELSFGVLSVAAPVLDASRAVIAAINSSVHVSAYDSDPEAMLTKAVVNCALEISAVLGYRGDGPASFRGPYPASAVNSAVPRAQGKTVA